MASYEANCAAKTRLFLFASTSSTFFDLLLRNCKLRAIIVLREHCVLIPNFRECVSPLICRHIHSCCCVSCFDFSTRVAVQLTRHHFLSVVSLIDLGCARVTPRILHHTYCTRLFDSGLDVKEAQRMMGHANPAVTLEIYTHCNEENRSTSTAQKIRSAL